MYDRASDRELAVRLIEQAAVIRRLFPSVADMRDVPVPPALPTDRAGDPDGLRPRAAIRFLIEEMRLVQTGGAATLSVLDDEVAHTRRVMAETAT